MEFPEDLFQPVKNTGKGGSQSQDVLDVLQGSGTDGSNFQGEDLGDKPPAPLG